MNRITIQINDDHGKFLTLVDLWDAKGSIQIEDSGVVIGTYYESIGRVVGQHTAIGHNLGTVRVEPRRAA